MGRRLLFDLAKDKDSSVRKRISIIIYNHFESLPEDYRQLLFGLAKEGDSSVRERVTSTVGRNFESLPEGYRRLLFILSKDEVTEVKTAVALAVAWKFEDLHPEYREILKKFKTDSRVLDSLREWIEEMEAYSCNEKTIKILKRELDL
jgi:hypothetical protein